MYDGFSKEAGSIIGPISAESSSIDLGEAQETTGAEESLLGFDNEGREVAVVAQIDPDSGDLAWIPTYDVDSVKMKTISMSQMGSMLRDLDRNRVYEQAIQKTIQSFAMKTSRPPVVLDIGAGTGLLSLFAARHGSSRVYAVEMFDAMASVAEQVVAANGLTQQIGLINAKSTAIEALPEPADILVTEVLDSALLGESILPTHSDAIQRLLAHDNQVVDLQERVIPNRSEVICSLVESWEVYSRVATEGLRCGKENWVVHRDESAAGCPGSLAALPVHWEALLHRGARELSAPTVSMKASFCQERRQGAELEAALTVWESDHVASEAGTITAVLMWWNTYLLPLSLDPNQEVSYTTRPRGQNWQDHWQQVVFPLRRPYLCQPGDNYRLRLVHDDTGIWAFLDPMEEALKSVTGVKRRVSDGEPRVRTAVAKPGEDKYLRPACACGWHLLCSPQRLQMLSDKHYNNLWGEAMERAVQELSARAASHMVMDLSDGSHLAIMAALAIRRLNLQAHCPAVVSREKKDFSRLFFSQISGANDLDDLLMLWDGQSLESILDYFTSGGEEMEDEEGGAEVISALTSPLIGLLQSDCCYYQLHALPTWQALSFYYQRRAFHDLLHPDAVVLPARAFIMVAAVELEDLHVSHGLVHNVCGFDHSPLDRVQAEWHEFIYPYYLANYRKRLLTRPVKLATLDYYTLSEQFDSILQQIVTVEAAGRCDGLAIWVDYDLDREGQINLQAFNGMDFSSYISQSVKFLPKPRSVQLNPQTTP
eukprot:gene3127-3424_t